MTFLLLAALAAVPAALNSTSTPKASTFPRST